MLDLALTDQAKMFNLINVGERAGSGLPRIRTVWQKQGWQEPKIVESFHPDRTTLLLPLAANKAAAKSGDKKVAAKSGGKSSSISEKRKNDILQYLDRHTGSKQHPNCRCHRLASFPHKDVSSRVSF